MRNAITKKQFARETGLVDDVLDRAWSAYKKQFHIRFWRWWTLNQGKYV